MAESIIRYVERFKRIWKVTVTRTTLGKATCIVHLESGKPIRALAKKVAILLIGKKVLRELGYSKNTRFEWTEENP